MWLSSKTRLFITGMLPLQN